MPKCRASKVGKMVDSSQADDRKLIKLVKERKLLYARNNMPVASFFSRIKVLWEEVALEMNWSVADVRRKWSHIRNSYSRHLRNEMQSARTAKGRMVSRWYLADELEFLKEHMATDLRPFPVTASFLSLDASDGRVSMEPPTEILWPLQTQVDDSDASSHSFTPEENASYFQFFRSIHNDYKELAPMKQRLFRRQCLLFLHELLDDEETAKPLITNVFVKEEKTRLDDVLSDDK